MVRVSVVSLGHTPGTRVDFGGTDMIRVLCYVLVWNDPLHDEVTETGTDTGGLRFRSSRSDDHIVITTLSTVTC
jgi:hypothetical protein